MKPGKTGEFVLGGYTSDSSLVSSSSIGYPTPLAAYIQDGGQYLWRNYYNTDHDMISAIKFNPDGTRIIAGFSVLDSTSKTNARLLFASLSPSDGSILYTYSCSPLSGSTSIKPKINPDGILFESSGDVFVAG
jgi:hypothetical protein